MSDAPKPPPESFLRKVARFVANPTTDWTELNSRQDSPENEQARAELRAMVERKRRNDFVRKRELNMLRRLRREGLTPEQLAAAGARNSSDLAADDRTLSEIEAGRDPVGAVKDKIDQIERQMSQEGFKPSMAPRAPTAAPPGAATASGSRGATLPLPVDGVSGMAPPAVPRATIAPLEFDPTTPAAAFAPTRPVAMPPPTASDFNGQRGPSALPASAVMRHAMPPPSEAGPSQLPTLPGGLFLETPSPPPPPPLAVDSEFRLVFDEQADAPAPESRDLGHDPDLDEAVIAFANGDNDSCEQSLVGLTEAGGPRNLHADTWLVRFDYYRATGQQAPFEALALDYVHLFGLSAPQWFSIPKLVAEGRKLERKPRATSAPVGGPTWSAPARLEVEAVALLKRRCETAPLPWVLDWQALTTIAPEALHPLIELLRAWSQQATEMRWVGGQKLLDLLLTHTATGERDTDPAWWMLRLEVLRISNRPDQFDEAAIDYCVTYEVSPPSWSAARCKVKMTSGPASTLGPSTNVQATEGLSGFLESGLADDGAMAAVAHLELAGQLIGDMTELLRQMSSQIGAATQVEIACPKLLRLDFIAAGDLLNWVIQLRGEGRSVQFVEAHRLVALFFGAMGINEHARIKVRAV